MSLSAPAPVDSTQNPDFKRPIADFSPSIWGDVFLQYDSQPMVLNFINFTYNNVLIAFYRYDILFFEKVITYTDIYLSYI